MNVIFAHSQVTVRNVQARCCCQQESLQALYWIVSVLLVISIDALLAVDSLSLTDVTNSAQVTVSGNVLVCKETVLSTITVVVAVSRKSPNRCVQYIHYTVLWST